MVKYNGGESMLISVQANPKYGTLLFRFDPDSPTYHKEVHSIGKYLKIVAGTGGTGNGANGANGSKIHNALEIKIEWERSSQ